MQKACMSVLGLLPPDEREEHEMWFKAKMMIHDECIANANQCVCKRL